jgi:dTDP-4-amino-4,6-dideoxygalactose transaminase
MSEQIPYGRPLIGPEEIAEVTKVLESGWLVCGPMVRKFESEFADYIGVRHAIAVNSCTAAIQLILVACGIGHTDEVMTTPLTFAATANAIVHSGAVPVFADVDLDTWNLSPGQAAKAMSPSVRAILPVHLLGLPARMRELLSLADDWNAFVISDAAHALETTYEQSPVGSLGLASAFSFQATKSVTTGEGGMITTNDDCLAGRIKILRSHGLDRDSWSRSNSRDNGIYDVVAPGFKYSMSDIAAAMGLPQLRRVSQNWGKRQRLVQIYDEAFTTRHELQRQPRPHESSRHAHHIYALLLDPDAVVTTRENLLQELAQEGVGSGVHYRALHLQKYYRERFGFQRGDYPNAEFVAARTFSLPLSASMSEADAVRVAAVVCRLLTKAAK